MAVSEQTIQEAIQDTIQALAAFADDSVVINDWTILDGSLSGSPFVIIVNADEFDSTQDNSAGADNFTIKLWLIESLSNTSWKDAYDNFRDHRQAIITAMKDGARSPGGAGVDVRRVRSDGPIGFIYPVGIDPEHQPDALPDYVAQYIALEVEEF